MMTICGNILILAEQPFVDKVPVDYLFLTVISAFLSMKNHYVSKVKNKPPDMLILVLDINKGVTSRRAKVLNFTSPVC